MSRRQDDFQFLTKSELKALLSEAKQRSRRLYTLIFLAYRHGLRASEACNIMLEDLDLDAGNIRCRRGKGSISNWQMLARDEANAVRRWLKERPKPDSPFLFPGDGDGALSRCQFFRDFRNAATAAGIPDGKRYPRVLKHSLGTHLANAGAPLLTIKQRLGHRDVANTMRYIEVANGFVDDTVAEAIAAGAVV